MQQKLTIQYLVRGNNAHRLFVTRCKC